MWIRTELRICHLYKRPRIWLQDEGTGKVLLKVREDPDLIKLAKQNRQSLQIRRVDQKHFKTSRLQDPIKRQSRTLPLIPRSAGTATLLLGSAAQGYETSKLLNGIAALADVTTDLYVTSGLCLSTGFLRAPMSDAGCSCRRCQQHHWRRSMFLPACWGRQIIGGVWLSQTSFGPRQFT